MPILLSLTAIGDEPNAPLYGAGPDGLFLLAGDQATPVPQPMTSLYCCAAVPSLAGPVLLVGGAPHGAAFCTLRAPGPLGAGDGGDWQAGWLDYTNAPVLQLAPAPHAAQSGLLLAATDGAGILRSANRGRTFALCNFGLHEFTILALAWAPPAPAGQWPAFELAFAGSDQGLYRSPASGLGWQRVAGVDAAVQALAVSPRFHSDGTLLAGTETHGLLRSTDGGRAFAPVPALPDRVDALLTLRGGGWLAATPAGIYQSSDSAAWALLPHTPAALCLLELTDGSVVAGGAFGHQRLRVPQPA